MQYPSVLEMNVSFTKASGHIGISTITKDRRKGYDAIGRLSQSAEYKGTDSSLTYKQTFDFDRFGNMYRKTANNGTSGQANPLPYTPIEDSDISKSTNRFTSDTTYDEAGEVTADEKFRGMGFGYDANGQMVKATKDDTPDALSVYDASGLRVAEKVNDVWRFLIYDIGGKLVAEYGGQQATDDGGVKYLLSDWQGSTRAIVSNAGYVLGRNDYTAYGEEIAAGTGLRTIAQGFGNLLNPRQKYGLTERDDATGLDHTPWRKHENQAGRWTGPDPYNGSMSLGDPQSFNRYSYVQNQPLNYVDPSGLNMVICATYEYGHDYKFPDGTTFHIVEGTYRSCFEVGGGGPVLGGHEPGEEIGAGGGGHLTDAQLNKIREDIPKALTDDCVDYINKLMRKHTGNDKWDARKDLLATFDWVRSQAPDFGIRWNVANLAGKREITLVRPLQGSQGLNIMTVIHELIHVAALFSGRRGSDEDLSETVQKLGIPVYLDNGRPMNPNPNPYDPKDVSYREYWAQGLKNHCPNLYDSSIH